MKKVIFASLMVLCMAFASNAQDGPKNPDRKAKFDALTPEQQAAILAKRAEMKAKFDAMTPEEKQAAKEKMKAQRDALKAMTPEERKAWRETHGPKKG